MAAFTINVAPYVDLGYVVGDYLSDSFHLSGIDADLRDTGGLRTQTTSFALTGVAAVTKSARYFFPSSDSNSAFTLSFINAAVNAQARLLPSSAPFQLSAFNTATTSQRFLRPPGATFLLRGFPVSFGDFILPFAEGTPPYSDLSDQSEDLENLRRSYGGSDNASPFFTRPQYVRWNSISKSKDLGTVRTIDAQVRGQIGSQVGSSTIFLRAEIIEPSKIRVTKLPASNRYDEKLISVGLLDGERKSIPLDKDGFASLPQSDAERLAATDGNTQQNFEFLPAGTYFFTVSSSQWRPADYGIEISVGGTIQLSGVIPLTLPVDSRLSASYLEGAAGLDSAAFGNLVVTWDLEGTAEGRLDPSLTLTRTSPFSTN